jgi:hypothetical protein
MQVSEAEELTSAFLRMGEIVLESEIDSPRVYREDEGRAHLGVYRAT